MEFHGEPAIWRFEDISRQSFNISSNTIITTDDILMELKKESTWIKINILNYQDEENIYN